MSQLLKTLSEAYASRENQEVINCVRCAKAQVIMLHKASEDGSPSQAHALLLSKEIERLLRSLGECS